MLRCTRKYQVLLDGYNLWIKQEQLYIMDYCFTTYGCPGLMVYNVWTSWIYGLKRVNIMDKFVELYLYMVIPAVPGDE